MSWCLTVWSSIAPLRRWATHWIIIRPLRRPCGVLLLAGHVVQVHMMASMFIRADRHVHDEVEMAFDGNLSLFDVVKSVSDADNSP